MNIKEFTQIYIIHKYVSYSKTYFFTVINQAEVAYREFLGKNRVKLNPGLRINLP